jgi:CheY-like chemotaxis protein
VTVESERGEGSKFTVSLPIVQPEQADLELEQAPQAEPMRPVLAPGEPRYRVLVADDDPFSRTLMQQVLGPVGFELHWAEDGVEAVEICRRIQPDFVLMDMRMPRLDGVDAVRQIREFGGNYRPTIVGISGDAFEDRKEAMAGGCDEYIPKPFHIRDLYAMFQRQRDVKFVFRDVVLPSVSAQALPDPIAERSLPQQWWKSLAEATALGDVARISRLAVDVNAQAPALATQLQSLIHKFDLRGIHEIAEKGSGSWHL